MLLELSQVILYTLDASEAEILSLKNFEVLMNYMKETIPQKIDASSPNSTRLNGQIGLRASRELNPHQHTSAQFGNSLLYTNSHTKVPRTSLVDMLKRSYR